MKKVAERRCGWLETSLRGFDSLLSCPLGADLDEGGLFECVVGWRAAVESFHVSYCEVCCLNFSFGSKGLSNNKYE